ncbi:MAG: DNA primase [Desulfurococcales archaeon]|nr:DNA primase [Desulfurococcales archaeon]
MLKYLLRFKIDVHGRVDKHDIIGAIFGQTEGLLGEDFDLRELQDKGRIGRIIVNISYKGSKTTGELEIPSNLSRPETAVLAAMIETIDKVGPYDSKIELLEIKDLRLEKLGRIVERAKEILENWREKAPDAREVLKEVSKPPKKPEIVEYGPEKLPAGPGIDTSDTIILVEGRADVQNLLRYGYTNVIAMGGAKEKVPETIKKLSQKKKVVAFVDGDRGGELILKTLLHEAKIDYVARAPPGKEVEDLTSREITSALKEMVPAQKYMKKLGIQIAEERAPPEKPPTPKKPDEVEKPVKEEIIEIPKEAVDIARDLKGTLEAVLFDEKWKPVKRVPVRELYNTLESLDGGVKAVFMDGIITQRVLDVAARKGVKLIVGVKAQKIGVRPEGVKFFTFNELFG